MYKLMKKNSREFMEKHNTDWTEEVFLIGLLKTVECWM